MFLAGYKDASIIAHSHGERVEGAMPSGFCKPVHHCTLVFIELGAKAQCCSALYATLTLTLYAAEKPKQQGLQILPGILEACIDRG